MSKSKLGHASRAKVDEEVFVVPRYIWADLEDLAEKVGTLRGDWNFGWGSLTGINKIPEYKNDVFALRSLCCGGTKEGHEAICPPNFEHFKSGITIYWGKHLGDEETFSNTNIRRSSWQFIMKECGDSTGISDDDVDMRIWKETSKCSQCEKSREELITDHGYYELDSLSSYGLCTRCREDRYKQLSEVVVEASSLGAASISFGMDDPDKDFVIVPDVNDPM